MQKQKSKAQLQRIVNRFNENYPVGSKVVLRKDTAVIETEVRAPAEILSGHSAVAWFKGVSGAYSIEDDRVYPSAMPVIDEALRGPISIGKSDPQHSE